MCLRQCTQTAAAGHVMRTDGLAPHDKGTAEDDARKMIALPPLTQLCIPGWQAMSHETLKQTERESD